MEPHDRHARCAARQGNGRRDVDVIVTDFGLDGHFSDDPGHGKRARRATEIDPDLKVMFITGFAAVALNAATQAPKEAKILSKPFHLRDLVNEVDRMLAA
jgi:DNA-binding NtrC family response regulator